MSDTDFEDLSALWQSASYEEDVAAIQTSVARHIRRAKFWTGLELVLSIAMIVFLGTMIAVFPSPLLVFIGVALIAFISWAFWFGFKSRFRFIDTQTGSASDIVKQAINRSNAAIQRYKVALFGLIPALVFGTVFGKLLVKNAKNSGGLPFNKKPLSDEWALVAAGVALLVLVGVTAYQFRREVNTNKRLQTLLTHIEKD